ncbi:hypothetical protein ACWEPO_30135 [Streptomyces albidoflavus]
MSKCTVLYGRLAEMTAPFSSDDVALDEYLWDALYEYGDGSIPEPGHIAEITNVWATSPEGYSSLDLALVARLTDGRWATCVAWADTTGFGCQQNVDWRINDNRELAISHGLDKESRAHLGLSLPGEETPA